MLQANTYAYKYICMCIPEACSDCAPRIADACESRCCCSAAFCRLCISASASAAVNESCDTYDCVIPRIRMSHVTRLDPSRHTYACVNHVKHMNESCHTWMSHVTNMKASRQIYAWVMPCIWMNHVTRINESCHTYKWVRSHIWMSHVTQLCISASTSAAVNGTSHRYESLMSRTVGCRSCRKYHVSYGRL